MKIARVLGFALLAAVGCWNAQGQTVSLKDTVHIWEKVRYEGGGVGITTDRRRLTTWNNRLTISSQNIELQLENGPSIRIDPARVVAVTYNQRAYFRTELMAVATVSLGAGMLLPLLTPKTIQHYIGIQYTLPDGTQAGLLLQADKTNHEAIFAALKAVTKVQ